MLSEAGINKTSTPAASVKGQSDKIGWDTMVKEMEIGISGVDEVDKGDDIAITMLD